MAKSKCRIEILPRAWEDLTSIEDYYYLQFDIESAQKVSDSILSSIETLEDFPNIDVLTPDKRLNQLGYRKCLTLLSVFVQCYDGFFHQLKKRKKEIGCEFMKNFPWKEYFRKRIA